MSVISILPVQTVEVPGKMTTSVPCIIMRKGTVAQQIHGSLSLKINTNPGEPGLMRCKRRADLSSFGIKVPKHSASVARRNERERNRVRQVNKGFETLRDHVPWGKKNKKMSKVETLKSAISYIRFLQEMLENPETAQMDFQMFDDDELMGQQYSPEEMCHYSQSDNCDVTSPAPSTSSDISSESFTSQDESDLSNVDLSVLSDLLADNRFSESMMTVL